MKTVLFVVGTLITAPALAQTPAPPSAPASLPNSGEIALFGTVSKINTQTREFVLSAGRFSLAGGKVGIITPPKLKVVRFGRAPQFALRVGQNLGVVGRDSGSGRALEARLLFLTAATQTQAKPASVAPVAAPPKDAPVIAPPNAEPVKATFPLEAKSGGWTFRVEEAGFSSTSLAQPGEQKKFSTPRFGVKAVTIAPDGTLARPANYKMRLLSPSGAPLLNQGELDPVSNEGEVDPDWGYVWADFSARAKPEGTQSNEKLADGEVNETIIVSLARPPAKGTRKLDAHGVTPSGVGVTISEIGLTDEGAVSIQCRLSAPASRPDTRVVPLEFKNFELLGDDGRPLETAGGDERKAANGDYVQILNFKQLPQDDEWDLRLRVSSIRRADALGDRIGARIKVPILAPPPLPLAAPALKGQNERVSVLLESDPVVAGELWHGSLWTRDTGRTLGRVWDVVADKAWWLKPGGAPQLIEKRSPLKLHALHGDGTRALPGEWQTILSLPIDPNDPKARLSNADFRFELVASTLLPSSFCIEAPVPAPGTTVKMDADVATDSNAAWTLQKIVSFSPAVPLARQGQGLPKSGLALVFEVSSFLTQTSLDPELAWARDEQGRPLDGGESRAWILGDLTQSKEQGSKRLTLILSLPAPDAKTVSVGATALEWGDGSETTTIEVHGAPLAPAPVK